MKGHQPRGRPRSHPPRPFYKRPKIPKGVRAEVKRRDGWRCRYCGHRVFSDGPWQWRLTIDHVVPCLLGGLSTVSNCVVACCCCNQRKDHALPEDHWSPKPPPTDIWPHLPYEAWRQENTHAD